MIKHNWKKLSRFIKLWELVKVISLQGETRGHEEGSENIGGNRRIYWQV